MSPRPLTQSWSVDAMVRNLTTNEPLARHWSVVEDLETGALSVSITDLATGIMTHYDLIPDQDARQAPLRDILFSHAARPATVYGSPVPPPSSSGSAAGPTAPPPATPGPAAP